jgi:transcriptional regulator with XRE-family HTH domain
MNINELITALESQAKEKGLSRTQLAAQLGISENYLYRIKTGSRRAGHKLLTAIRREFPSLKPLIWEYEESLVKPHQPEPVETIAV